MANPTYYQQSLLFNLGRQTGFAAFKCRQKKERYQYYTLQIHQWRQVFPLGEVITLGLAAVGLILMDFLFMLPIYRQVSQIIANDANLLVLPLGLGINVLAVITSDKLSKCANSGAFHKWEVLKQGEKDMDHAVFFLAFTRRERVFQFLIQLVMYLIVLLCLVWIRSMLISDSHSPMEKVELQMSLIGLLFALFALSVGMYLIPLAQYIIWSCQSILFKTQMEGLIQKVSANDVQINSLWKQTGMPVNNSQDIKEALIRYLFRTKSHDYCDVITAEEVHAFLATHQQEAGAKKPENQIAETNIPSH